MLSNNLKLHLAHRHKVIILDIIKSTCPQHSVWAYGSRVGDNNNDIYAGTDLDLVILGENAPIYQLKQLFAECNVPHLIDLVAWEHIPQSFKQEIQKRYVVFYTKTGDNDV